MHSGPAGRREAVAQASDASPAPAHSEPKPGEAMPAGRPPAETLALGSLQSALDRQPARRRALRVLPAPPTPRATPRCAIAGLAVEIAARAQAGRNRFEIRLDPPELGRIDVRLDVDRSGQVTSRLIVERAETLDLLRRDAPELERALQQAGLKTADNGLQFALRDQRSCRPERRPRRRPIAARLVVPDADLESVDDRAARLRPHAAAGRRHRHSRVRIDHGRHFSVSRARSPRRSTATPPRPRPARPASTRTRSPATSRPSCTLLTTQLKNQNPLDPLDTNQFTQQLVQFAQVEQQMKQNEQLASLVAMEKTAQATTALAYVGQTVAVDGQTAALSNGEATWSFVAPKPVSAAITVKSATGQTVYTGSFTINTGTQNFTWDGRDNNGVKWPDGNYTMSVTAKDASGQSVAISSEVQGVVDSVDLTKSPPVLSIGGQTFTLDKIKRVVRV